MCILLVSELSEANDISLVWDLRKFIVKCQELQQYSEVTASYSKCQCEWEKSPWCSGHYLQSFCPFFSSKNSWYFYHSSESCMNVPLAILVGFYNNTCHTLTWWETKSKYKLVRRLRFFTPYNMRSNMQFPTWINLIRVRSVKEINHEFLSHGMNNLLSWL